MASKDIKEEEADPVAPPFEGIKNELVKNELARMIALFEEIVSKLDSSNNIDEAQFSEATTMNDGASGCCQWIKKALSHKSSEAGENNDEANPQSHQSSEATTMNDGASGCCQWIKKTLSHKSSEAGENNDEANPHSHQSSEANKKNVEKIKLKAEFEEIVSKWDSSLALRSRWIKNKLEKLKALFEGRLSKWEDNQLDQVSAFEREVSNLVSGPYDNDVDKLNRIIGDIQRLRILVTPEMAPVLESRIRSMIKADHPEERSSFQRIKNELEKMIPLFCEDNILSLMSAFQREVDNLVSEPYDNNGDKLNRIIGYIQRIRNLVTPGPGTAPGLEYRILMISEAIQKKEPHHPEEENRFQKIKTELERMIAQFHGQVSTWEEYLLGQVSALERDVANLVSGPDDNNGNTGMKLNSIIDDLKRISKLVTPVRPINIDLERGKYQPEEVSAKKASEEWQLHVEKKFFEIANVKNLKVSFENLEGLELKLCLLFLSIFPENSVIKKRPLIYWWIGEGLIKAERDKTAGNKIIKTAEEVGENIFSELIAENLIIAKFDNKWNWSPVVNRCVVHPWIRHMLISSAKEAQLFVFDSTGTPSSNITYRRVCLDSKSSDKFDKEADKLLTIFNVNQRYPFKDADWLRKLKNVVALQLGRWQDSVKHHIEMEDKILKDLGAQEYLKYLSLRGISRITKLPDSIVNLISLEILDLRACHNLERLPDKIGSLKKLTHLDVSECYLLESMPKELEKLTALQVLKGFVVGDTNKTSCRIGSLGNMKMLRRLGIRIGKTAVNQNVEFENLGGITSLRCLTISWGKCPSNVFNSLLFPYNLEKLDLRGIPLEKAPEWLHSSKLQNLKKLYIRGGKLGSEIEETGSTWNVEKLVLKYLVRSKIKSSKTEPQSSLKEKRESQLSKIKAKFGNLRYVEIINCHGNYEDIVWDESKGWLWPEEKKA